jgi:hypothetical protein
VRLKGIIFDPELIGIEAIITIASVLDEAQDVLEIAMPASGRRMTAYAEEKWSVPCV